MAGALAWLTPTRWLLLIAAGVALVLGYEAWAGHQQALGAARADARWQLTIARLQRDAAAALASETSKVRAAEQALQAAKTHQEATDAKNQTTITSLAQRLRALAATNGHGSPAGPGIATGAAAGAAAWRLRDPNAPTCWGSGGGAPATAATAAADRAADAAPAGGLLSEQLSELLYQRLREADEINAAYLSCRADAMAVRAQLPQ